MPELNSRNIVEPSRTEIHDDDIHLRDLAQESEMVQVSDLKKDFYNHCIQNEKSDKTMNAKIDSIMWLADPEIKNTMKKIVLDNQVNQEIGKLVVKVIGVIAAVIAIVWGAIQIFHNWK